MSDLLKFLEEQAALARLAEEYITESVDSVWKKLLDYKEGLLLHGRVEKKDQCSIDVSDEKTLKAEISKMLEKGWTEGEVYNHLKWTEYFDDYTHSEDECLKMLKQTAEKADARVGK